MSWTRIIVFLAVIAFLCIYLGKRYYGAARTVAKRPAAMILAAIGVALGIGFFASTIVSISDPRPPSMLAVVFAITMPWTLYMTLGYLAIDALRLVRLRPKRPSLPREFLVLAALSCAVTAYGIWNVRAIAVRRVEILASKPDIDLKIAFVADLHIGGPGMTPAKLEKAVAEMNAFSPDLVLLGGDIVDRRIREFADGGYDAILGGLRAKRGVYAILGNHEYYRNDIGNVMREYEKAGIATLRDEAVDVAGIRLIGADDPASIRFGKRPALLRAIVRPSDGFKLLLMHNPSRQKEAEKAGADLMLSGHTHAGQLFPISLMLYAMYDTVYGYARDGAMQVYVTSGIGIWGSPVRTAGRSEIVLLHIKSEK
ncbi:MAG: metallophosphoesterase [Rickettsiales bacterium]|jgi:predicted MPP superfamily phosphohydrolase|nr:metallophosphoesterase [Rickettsiales bacterium]